MKIFKNRGDFYIPKTGVKGTKQAKILYFLLAVIIVFTVVFVVLLSQRYSTAAEFFGEGEVVVTEEAVVDDEILPSISGKTNYLIFETDDEDSVLHFVFLLQADKDNLAYKASALSPNMKIDGVSLFDIYSAGGGAALQTRLMEYFGFEIDYYAAFKTNSFVEFLNKLGSFVYLSSEEIRFSGGKGDDKYTIHINEGEQSLSGREIINLVRYYSQKEKNYVAENEVVLIALTELFNADNFEDSEALFRLFIKSASTDITVRDFENGKDSLTVFCTKNMDITIYSAEAKYENNELTPDSAKQIKGYFSK